MNNPSNEMFATTELTRSESSRLISVIIPAYNSSEYIAETLLSLQSQSLKQWEAIVVDDESTDDTVSVVKAFTAEDQRIKLRQRKNNGGPAAAMNTGLAAISEESEYVFFLGSDDQLLPNYFSLLSVYLDRHQDVGAVGFQALDLEPDGGLKPARRSRYVPGRILPRDLGDSELTTPFVTFLCVTGNGAFYLFRKTLIEAIGPYDERLKSHEDSDLLCRASLAADVHMLPTAMYIRRVREGSMRHEGNALGCADIFNRKWEQRSIHERYNHKGVDIEAALKYKHTIHVPLRDLKVASKKLSRSLQTRNGLEALMALGLVRSAVRGFLGATWRQSQKLRPEE